MGTEEANRTCLGCHSGALRDAKDPKRDRTLREMAKQGWVNCQLSPFRATFHPRNHTCKNYTEASKEVARARREWAGRAD